MTEIAMIDSLHFLDQIHYYWYITQSSTVLRRQAFLEHGSEPTCSEPKME